MFKNLWSKILNLKQVIENEPKHDWEIALHSYDEYTHEEYIMHRCQACGKYKKEYTGNIYGQHKCEFCNSIETTKYPSENTGYVWLCEDCHNISQDDR